MKINLKKYLLYSSILIIFSEALYFKFLIDWKLFYVIILSNFYFLSRLKKIVVDKNIFLIFLFLLIHGLINYFFLWIPINFLLSQLIGIGLISTYYYNFVNYFNKKKIIEFYCKAALFIAAIGYPMWLLDINLNDGIRFQSIFTEPAHYAIVVIPACYYFLKEEKYKNFIIIFGSLILSQSSIGFLGCALMFILPNINKKRIGYFFSLIPILVIITWALYEYNPRVNLRVNGTYEALKSLNHGKFDYKTNESSYALLSNLFVAKENFLDHPLGSGLGSHHYMHTKKYYFEMRPPSYMIELKTSTINSKDAASLSIRLLSELGIFGLLFICILIYIFIQVFSLKDMYFEQGIIIYLILKLIRDGHYFPPEFYFFVFILYFSLRDKVKIFDNERN